MPSAWKDTLQDLLNDRMLRRMAGASSFERGGEYFANGQVGPVAEHDRAISAKVQGSRTYRVKLWGEEKELEYSCTCPVATDGAFCKHCVALGLAWLDQKAPVGSPGKKQKRTLITTNDVRSCLLADEKETLVEMLME